MGIFGEQFAQEALAAAEVPQLLVTHNNSSVASNRTSKSYISHKKPRIEVLNDQDDDDEFSIFIVPDLGWVRGLPYGMVHAWLEKINYGKIIVFFFFFYKLF